MNTSTIDTTSTLLSPAASGNSSLGPTPFPPPGMSGVPQPPVTVADGCVIAFMFGLWFYSLYLTYRLDKFSGLWFYSLYLTYRLEKFSGLWFYSLYLTYRLEKFSGLWFYSLYLTYRLGKQSRIRELTITNEH